MILSIDPGLKGALVLTDCSDWITVRRIPLILGKSEINFAVLRDYLKELLPQAHVVVIERAIPMAMGSKAAFSYGMGFERIIRAVDSAGVCQKDAWLIEPSKWARTMHEGTARDLRPKARSLVAVKALFPRLVRYLPRDTKGRLLDGPVDALLIAGYAYLNQPCPSNASKPVLPVIPFKPVKSDTADDELDFF